MQKDSGIKLWPHQQEAVEKTMEAFKEGKNSLIVTMPTGSGKTVFFANIANRFTGRVLILAHRQELIQQAWEKLRAFSGICAGIEMAQRRAASGDRVVIGSVQTLAGRTPAGPPFELVIVDEAHHTAAESYLGILDRLHPEKTLGVTATPYRGDKRALADIFEHCPYQVSMLNLIGQGYLCDVRIKALPVKIDMSTVRVRQGDFAESDLGNALKPHIGALADIIAQDYPDRRLLTFAPLRATSADWTEALQARGLPAAHVDGESADRAKILAEFKSGKIRYLSNAMLLTEGYDEPSINTILILRPTKSRGLYAQMIGRGTRICEGKDRLLVLDPLFVSERHNILTAADLVAEDDKNAARIARRLRQGLDLTEAVEAANRDHRDDLAAHLAQSSLRTGYEVTLAELALSLDFPALEDWEPSLHWHSAEASPAQIAALEKAGVNTATITSRGLAHELMDCIKRRREKGLATLKQVRLIRRLGHPCPESETFQGASQWIDRALSNKRQ